MDERLLILAGTFFLVVLSLILLIAVAVRVRRSAREDAYEPTVQLDWPDVALGDQQASEDDVFAEGGGLVSVLNAPLRTGEWRPPEAGGEATAPQPQMPAPVSLEAPPAPAPAPAAAAPVPPAPVAPVAEAPPLVAAGAPPPPAPVAPAVETPTARPGEADAGLDSMIHALAMRPGSPPADALVAQPPLPETPRVEEPPVEPPVVEQPSVESPTFEQLAEALAAEEAPGPPAPAPAPAPAAPAPVEPPPPAPAPAPAAPAPLPIAPPETDRPRAVAHVDEPLQAPAVPPRPPVSVPAPRQEPAPQAVVSADVRVEELEDDASTEPEIPDVVLVAPVEMWFGDSRVGVKKGTRTHDMFQKYARVLFDEYRRAKSDA